jgi:predicted aldo/keto reductase-like oxidoreductase
VQLSIIGFGGNIAVGMKQNEVNRTVDEAVELGVNYFERSSRIPRVPR